MSTTVSRLRRIHPGWILVVLDVIGLAIASDLSVVELGGASPCADRSRQRDRGPERVSTIGRSPVAVYGVALSLVLLTMAIAWIRTDNAPGWTSTPAPSLVGVIFEV